MIVPGARTLTPLGAQQMLSLGRQLRGRYLGDPIYDGLGHDPIPSLATDELDPDQLLIQTLDEPHLVASAQALLQGLYPPYSSNETRNGMSPNAKYVLTDGSAVDYPLQGYQYAPIATAGETSVESIWIAGGADCPMGRQASVRYLMSEEVRERREETGGFYGLFGEEMFGGALRRSQMCVSSSLRLSVSIGDEEE